MYAEERQQAIAQQVTRRGRVSVIQLAEEFAVTTETIRRDLSTLERAGLLRRVHGGAIGTDALTVVERGLTDRDQANTDQKDRIAAAAAAYLPATGGSVLLDAGSTTGRLAGQLPGGVPLTVYTSSVPIAAQVAPLPNVELHLLPGRVRSTTLAAVGTETVEALARVRVDVAFLGTNGLTLEHGLSTPDVAEAAAKRRMIASAHTVIVLADSTKFGRESTVSFAALDDVDVVVTDAATSADDVAALERLGLDVVVV